VLLPHLAQRPLTLKRFPDAFGFDDEKKRDLLERMDALQVSQSRSTIFRRNSAAARLMRYRCRKRCGCSLYFIARSNTPRRLRAETFADTVTSVNSRSAPGHQRHNSDEKPT
jgi:hypothetical protein